MLSFLLQIVSVGCICGFVFVRVRPRPTSVYQASTTEEDTIYLAVNEML